MTLYYKNELTDGQCGLGRIYRLLDDTYFEDTMAKPSWDLKFVKPNEPMPLILGTGYFGTGMVDSTFCRKWWKYLVSWYPIVFQTEPRTNKNSMKLFVYVMFDQTKQYEKQKTDNLPEFPL